MYYNYNYTERVLSAAPASFFKFFKTDRFDQTTCSFCKIFCQDIQNELFSKITYISATILQKFYHDRSSIPRKSLYFNFTKTLVYNTACMFSHFKAIFFIHFGKYVIKTCIITTAGAPWTFLLTWEKKIKPSRNLFMFWKILESKESTKCQLSSTILFQSEAKHSHVSLLLIGLLFLIDLSEDSSHQLPLDGTTHDLQGRQDWRWQFCVMFWSVAAIKLTFCQFEEWIIKFK